MIIGKVLRKQGHKISTAMNGEEALRKLAEVRNDQNKTMRPFDVMLIDLQMPIMDGM